MLYFPLIVWFNVRACVVSLIWVFLLCFACIFNEFSLTLIILYTTDDYSISLRTILCTSSSSLEYSLNNIILARIDSSSLSMRFVLYALHEWYVVDWVHACIIFYCVQGYLDRLYSNEDAHDDIILCARIWNSHWLYTK